MIGDVSRDNDFVVVELLSGSRDKFVDKDEGGVDLMIQCCQYPAVCCHLLPVVVVVLQLSNCLIHTCCHATMAFIFDWVLDYLVCQCWCCWFFV